MRSFLSAIAAIAALLLFTAAVPAQWIQQNIVQEEGFVSLTAPIADDPRLPDAVASTAAEAIAGSTPLAGVVQPLIGDAATAAVNDPGFSEAWAKTMRASHALSFGESPMASGAEVSGPETSGTDSLGAFSSGTDAASAVNSATLDVAPLAELAAEQVTESIGVPVPTPESVPVQIGSDWSANVLDSLARYAELGLPLAVGAAGAAVLALLVARRRSTTLSLLGLGAAAGAGLGWLAMQGVRGVVVATATPDGLAGVFADALMDEAAHGYSQWTVVIVSGAAVLFAVG